MPAGNRDERKSGHMGLVSSAYGNTGQSLLNPDVSNPFNQPGSLMRDAGGRGGGLPLSGGGNSSQFMDPRFAPTATDILPAANASPALASWEAIRRRLMSPQGVTDLAGLIPALLSMRGAGGDGNPFADDAGADIMAEITRSLELQRKRLEQAQPVYDNLVRMATTAAPNASYGGPAYAYRGPQFGG